VRRTASTTDVDGIVEIQTDATVRREVGRSASPSPLRSRYGGLTIDQAVGDDAIRLTKLCRSSTAYRGIYADAIATVQVTPAYITENIVAVATNHNGQLLGFYSLIRDPPELDMMFVADDAQRSGTGRALGRT
jgi:hypothetical protein